MAYHYKRICVRVIVKMVAAFMVTRAVAAQACPTGPALTAGTQHCSSNLTGTVGSFGWSIWSSGSGGCITPYGNTAAFKATWNNAGDFLAREGFQWNGTKTYDQYGNVTADYAYTKSGTAGGYSFIGIYGWSENPLVEYYVVDDWFGTGSAPTGGGTLMGTFTVDSGTYKVYTHQQVNQPSIQGTTTFMQFFSIRQTPRQCGHISLTAHYDEWKSLKMNLGNMYQAQLLIEAGGDSGSIDFSVGTMSSGTATPVSSSPKSFSEFARPGEGSLGNGKNGVLSLVSLKGDVIRSVRQSESKAAALSTVNLPTGLYLLRFQGDGGTLETRKLVIQ